MIRALVRDAYEEIMNILAGVEKRRGMQAGLLKKIYDKESSVVYLRSRELIYGDLREIVFNASERRKVA